MIQNQSGPFCEDCCDGQMGNAKTTVMFAGSVPLHTIKNVLLSVELIHCEVSRHRRFLLPMASRFPQEDNDTEH